MIKQSKDPGFRYPLHTPLYGKPYIFLDEPSCLEIKGLWEKRKSLRDSMSEEQRLEDSLQKGYFLNDPPVGYSRSCQCTVCKLAYWSTFSRGILGKPSEENYTFTRAMELLKSKKETLAHIDDPNLNQTLNRINRKVVHNGGFCIARLDVRLRELEDYVFLPISTLWVEMTSRGEYWNVPVGEEDFLPQPQPPWFILVGINEVVKIQNNPDLIEDLCQRKLAVFHLPGPMSEPQAMMVFNMIRLFAERGLTTMVNTDCSHLISFVNRLKKSME